ncbi:LysR family transcriptional regulator [Nitrospirillum amazonense]|uniref:LysR family transcriptional regulator n=1 Tax=Nitrospirillum amazonense TaxID=28077 RepID=UPI0024126636|nr:LysR family transcriptional regulator [Nitrospirillum amazonense]MDG3442833.1 LysR family transcriptional regulator [Nitrospirillum amazonense]
MTGMDWNDLKYFLAVARTGSLTRTSADLGVSQSTVGRRIAEFEESIGMVLFQRHQTGYFLTDEGRELLRYAERVEDGILALERGAAGLDKTPAGTVRLATSENLATDLIIPALPAFRDRYPGICLEIITSTVTAELGRREADIALRVVRPTRGNLTVRRVGHMTYSVYGSREYIERHPPIAGEPLGGRHFIAWDDGHAFMPAATWLAREYPGCKIALVASSLPAQIAAVRAGLGLAVIPDFLTMKEDFIRVIPPDQMFSAEVWLVTHADLVASARVRAVGDFLTEEVMRANPELSGRQAPYPAPGAR